MAKSSTQFKPGQSGNPAGKPKHARNRLTLAFLNALADDFEKHGTSAITQARKESPVGYLTVCARVIPQQLDVAVTDADAKELTDAELADIARGGGERAAEPPISTH